MATARQEKAMIKLVENGGKSVSKAMRDAGYSAKTAHNPEKLTKSKSWKQLVDQYLPNDMLLEKVHELIGAKKKVTVKTKGEVTATYESVDTYAQKSGLDFAFKIKNSYAGKKDEFEDPLDLMDNEQLEAKLAEFEALEDRYLSASMKGKE